MGTHERLCARVITILFRAVVLRVVVVAVFGDLVRSRSENHRTVMSW